jgi:hypothetical protein
MTLGLCFLHIHRGNSTLNKRIRHGKRFIPAFTGKACLFRPQQVKRQLHLIEKTASKGCLERTCHIKCREDVRDEQGRESPFTNPRPLLMDTSQ